MQRSTLHTVCFHCHFTKTALASQQCSIMGNTKCFLHSSVRVDLLNWNWLVRPATVMWSVERVFNVLDFTRRWCIENKAMECYTGGVRMVWEHPQHSLIAPIKYTMIRKCFVTKQNVKYISCQYFYHTLLSYAAWSRRWPHGDLWCTSNPRTVLLALYLKLEPQLY